MPVRRGASAISLALLPLALGVGACSLAISTSGLSNGAVDETVSPPDGGVAGDDAMIADAGSGDAAESGRDADARGFPTEAQVFAGNGHGYAVYRAPAGAVSWADARMLAQAAGGHLATFASFEENEFVKSIVATRADAFMGSVGPWLGGYQPSPSPTDEPGGGWQWVDGTPWTFTAWASAQPDNAGGHEDYLDFYEPSGVLGWNDDSLTGSGEKPNSYVVEYE